MSTVIKRVFRAPYSVPNGLHATADGLWVVDQITDRVASIGWGEPNDYGVTTFLRDIPTESSNTSGLTYGDGSLWLAANGAATIWRPPRPTDADKGKGEILRVDPVTGATVERWPVPDGGGVHGIEYDPFEPGRIWVTTLHSQTLSKVRIADWEVELVLPLPYPRAHGVIRVEDGIWVVFTSHRVIVKLDLEEGNELARINVPGDQPEPHCLTRWQESFYYCDATTGWIASITPGSF
jgi:sugar lactone lactonase YvrE